MLDTYKEKQDKNLQELKIGSLFNFILEEKKDDEIFEDFDSSEIIIKYCV